MIAVLVADDDTFSRQMSHRLRLQGYTLVRYRDPVKLSDNVAELAPALVVINARDFPLHWQILTAEISLLGLSDTAVILAGPSCPQNFNQYQARNLCWLEYDGSIDKNKMRACLAAVLPAKFLTSSNGE